MEPVHLDVANVLDQTLTDLINLGLIAKQAHWSLVGPSFGSLHPLFDELADVARDGGDRVAERAVSLGRSPDGRVETAARDNPLPSFDLGPLRDVDAIPAFRTILEIVTTHLFAGISASACDPVTPRDLDRDRRSARDDRVDAPGPQPGMTGPPRAAIGMTHRSQGTEAGSTSGPSADPAHL